jgi:hypothetical protein
MRHILIWCVLFAAVSPAAGKGEFSPADATARGVQLRSEPASYEKPIRDGSTEMAAHARCSSVVPRQIDVTVTWHVERKDAQAHRVDVTSFSDGFTRGSYLTSGERQVSVAQLPFEDAEPGIFFYWRVLTKTPEGWVVSGTGRFEAPICPADDEEKDR